MTNVSTAIKRWANEANSDAQNLAIFYFCGHGLSVGLNNGLLVEDFGDDHSDWTILKNMINVDNLNLATDLIRGRKQCFFIDACPNSPTLMAQRAGQGRMVQISSNGAEKGNCLAVYIKSIVPRGPQPVGTTALIPEFGGLVGTTATAPLNKPLAEYVKKIEVTV